MSVGERVYEVREALGTRRKPLSQDAFAALLTAQGGRTYYGSEFSLIERDAKALTLDDVAVIAAVDPHHRGKLWLAWGEATDSTLQQADPISSAEEPKAKEMTGFRAETSASMKKPGRSA
jgi:hypothetical protein